VLLQERERERESKSCTCAKNVSYKQRIHTSCLLLYGRLFVVTGAKLADDRASKTSL
jgi:hypothetical protein